jgi:hypothetical protein
MVLAVKRARSSGPAFNRSNGGIDLIACAALMIAQQVASKAVRDALFLGSFPAIALPKVMLAAALLSFPMARGVSRAISRFGPVWVTRIGFALNGAGSIFEWFLVPDSPRLAAVCVYFHVATLGGALISAFWSLANERFDPHTMKESVGRLLAAGGLGGLVGGLLAQRVAHAFGSRNVLLCTAALSIACAALLVHDTPRSIESVPPSDSSSAWSSLSGSAYLRRVAALLIVTSAMTALLDFMFKARAARSLPTSLELTQFFATFYTVTSLASVVTQLTLTRPALGRLGLGSTLALLPGAVLVTSILGIMIPGLWPIALTRGSAATLENSLFRSAYEPLYTPIREERKRAIKTVIDVAGPRIGDALGSVLVLGVIGLFPMWNDRLVGLLASAAAIGALGLARSLHHGYVRELAASLRGGLITLDDRAPGDSTTRRTLTLTMAEIQRERLSPFMHLEARILQHVQGLLGEGSHEVEEALAHVPHDARLVPFAIDLLARDDMAPRALAALRASGKGIVGQLVDVLSDANRPVSVRCRTARILKTCAHTRAVRGLVDALFDSSFEVRYASAQALEHLSRSRPGLAPPRELLLTAVERELNVPAAEWRNRKRPATDLDGHPDERRAFGPGAVSSAASVSLEHVFGLLRLVFDADGLDLAHKALFSSDPRRRGTALEYLENVLPEGIRHGLLRHVAESGRGLSSAASREGGTLAERLKQSLRELDRPETKRPRSEQ